MLQDTLRQLFNRDLNKLKNEIELYPEEKAMWIVDGQIANSAGNLCLHLIGNLNTYIGTELGGTGYVRHRDLEFSLKNIPVAELMKSVEDTMIMVDTVLSKLNNEQLELDYPVIVLEHKTSTGFFLMHLSTHLTYHLGQINYHRRLLA